ncbi:NTP transferase domain-containing protein [Microbacterium sp. NPDC089320]|uniref:molybdenum cofactor guanylyltransferase n=1 Tax=Microbacterium sp. NPDC089320 TaxID=3155182 RepID=UPI003415C388
MTERHDTEHHKSETRATETRATEPTAAIILAGGRASRLGGAVKPLLDVAGRTLLDHAVAAVDGCDPVIVVGPSAPTRDHVVWTRESPEFGGPVAGIAAGLALVDTADVLLLAADLPNAVDAVALLHRHPRLSGGEDGVCLIDASERMQWLVGRYRADALRAALATLPDGGRDASLRSLLAGLRIRAVPAGELATDVDTWDDLERARAASPTSPRGSAPDEETT